MPNYKEFEGVNLITDPTQKTIAQVLIKNELGGVSNGYQLDHAGTSNSGYSFGGNQMDLSKNANGREIFSTIIKAELGDNFYNSIKDRVVQAGNQNILTQQNQNQFNRALKFALDQEEKFKNRPLPKWICSHGIEALSGELKYKDKATWEKDRNEIRAKYINQIK